MCSGQKEEEKVVTQYKEDWEDVDTYKYSDYPVSGISPQQHAPQAAAGPPAAAAGTPAAAAAAPAGGIPLLVPAAAGPIPPAAPPGSFPVAAAAAAFPANVVNFAPPTEWQVLSPLPPDDPNDSFSNEFVDANEPESDDKQAAGTGEDRFWLESERA